MNLRRKLDKVWTTRWDIEMGTNCRVRKWI